MSAHFVEHERASKHCFMNAPLVSIQLNGRLHQVPDQCTVAALLVRLQAPRHVAVEVNHEVVPRAQHASVMLRAGDCVELVTLVGGG